MEEQNASKTDNHCCHADGAEDRSGESDGWWKFSSFWTAVGTIVIAIFTVVLSLLASLQWCEMKAGSKQTAIVNRAFVYPLEIRTATVFYSVGGRFIEIQPVLTNSGNTPTRDLRIYASWQPFLQELPDNFDFPDFDETGKRTLNPQSPIVTLGPKAITPTVVNRLNTDQMKAVNAGMFYYEWGWAKYRDMFDDSKEHITRSLL